MAIHSALTGTNLHEAFHYVQESDPEAVGAGKYWLKVSTGEVKRRNTGDTDWDQITTGGRLTFSSTIPNSPTATGVAGATALNLTKDKLRICVATNTWREVSLVDLVPSTGVTYTFASSGDANGVFYGLGVIAGTGTWTNPFTASAIAITCSSAFASGTGASLVDRVASDAYSNNSAGSSFLFDLKVGNSLVLSHYSYRARSSTGSFPTAWILEGSNDNTNWTTLDTKTGITIASSAWLETNVSSFTAYRYFRLRSTALDSSNFSFFTIGEFELYGTYNY